MAWRLAIDIGGTFTDLVALDEASGRIHLLKVRTTFCSNFDGCP